MWQARIEEWYHLKWIRRQGMKRVVSFNPWLVNVVNAGRPPIKTPGGCNVDQYIKRFPQTHANPKKLSLTDLCAPGNEFISTFIQFIMFFPGQEQNSQKLKKITSMRSSSNIHQQSINDSSRNQQACANRRKYKSTSRL